MAATEQLTHRPFDVLEGACRHLSFQQRPFAVERYPMPISFPPGPYKQVQTSQEGVVAPWYIIPFDADGTCNAPLTRRHLLDALEVDAFTHVFVFSHGWNNDWEAASNRYESFIQGFVKMRREYALPLEGSFRPLLVGIFWPSTALVMPWERAPKFASAGANDELERRLWREEVETLAPAVAPADRENFYCLTQDPEAGLGEQDALRLAHILANAVQGMNHADADTPVPGEPLTGEKLLERARGIPAPPASGAAPGTFGFANRSPTGAVLPLRAAFELSDLDPRKLVRVATVLQMKDRAAVVGSRGVGPLLKEILAKQPAKRVHLVGHSYGAIVLLAAVCLEPADNVDTQVESVLLLQPALSQWCFAGNVADKGFPGSYRSALKRVRGSIFCTFSKHDEPLTKLFHLAARRDEDLTGPKLAGAPDMAGGLPKAPSLYAALGGFGPAGLQPAELMVQPMKPPPGTYALPNPAPKVIALNGDAVIDGHGDISVPASWWALFQQI